MMGMLFICDPIPAEPGWAQVIKRKRSFHRVTELQNRLSTEKKNQIYDIPHLTKLGHFWLDFG